MYGLIVTAALCIGAAPPEPQPFSMLRLPPLRPRDVLWLWEGAKDTFDVLVTCRELVEGIAPKSKMTIARLREQEAGAKAIIQFIERQYADQLKEARNHIPPIAMPMRRPKP